MSLDSYIDIDISLQDMATVREIFAATRDELLIHFDKLPTKEEAKEWLDNDVDVESIVTSVFFSLSGNILESNILDTVNNNFDDFYEYVVNTYEF